jgi:hypothetical protein
MQRALRALSLKCAIFLITKSTMQRDIRRQVNSLGVQLRREVPMSSVIDYFERMHRKEHLNPSSHWFTIAGGILFSLKIHFI